MKILILEDEPMMAKLLETLLKLEGFETITPLDVESLSPKSILDFQADVILMDANLGSKTSLPWLAKMNRNRNNSPHIIMTSGMDLGKECMEAGADAFLLKPYMPEDLIALIKDKTK